jgi:hypothetical protein
MDIVIPITISEVTKIICTEVTETAFSTRSPLIGSHFFRIKNIHNLKYSFNKE